MENQNPSDGSWTDEEVARRRDEALRRALNTPPQHRHGRVKESTEGQPKEMPKGKSRVDQKDDG